MVNTIVEILCSADKKELTAKCKRIEIQKTDFTDFILLCKSGLCHLEHRMEFFDFVPEDVQTREEDWDVLNAPPSELNLMESKKSLRRLFKMHGMRKYIVGHLFIESDKTHNPEWHFIFFEINELKDRNNHWSEGAHVHLVNHLFPSINVQDVWSDFIKNKKTPSSKLHIRFNDPLRK
jgi:hypothetical protein